MPVEPSSLVPTFAAAVTGLFASLIAFFGFTGKFQTKGGCKEAHAAYELTQISRRETQEAKLETVVVQQTAIHKEVSEMNDLVKEIARAVFVPRTSFKTRDSDNGS